MPESILVSYVGKKSVDKATIESILRRTLPHAMSSVCFKCNTNIYLLVNYRVA